jgi:hypothetical protein
MNTVPNLAGVATRDLVEKIGTGKFSAAYINWSRTMNLLRTHAPNWLVDYVPTKEGSLIHAAPVGAYLLIRFLNMETGFSTPALPQAVMDHRNKSIPFDQITSRDITDTQRRGMCMAAAMHFGLAYELWAKMPLESGYSAPDSAPKSESTSTPVQVRSAADVKASEGESVEDTAEASEATFRESALEKGVETFAIDALVKIVTDKLEGDWDKGLKTLQIKSAAELNEKYAPDKDGW